MCIKREINLRRRRKKKGWSFGFDKVTWGIYKKKLMGRMSQLRNDMGVDYCFI